MELLLAASHYSILMFDRIQTKSQEIDDIDNSAHAVALHVLWKANPPYVTALETCYFPKTSCIFGGARTGDLKSSMPLTWAENPIKIASTLYWFTLGQ